MGNLVELNDHRPHLSGEAHCLSCGHEWVAVCPVGVNWLECPDCGCFLGRRKYPVLREKELHWHCHCGNDLFQVTEQGYYCPNCGEWQHGF